MSLFRSVIFAALCMISVGAAQATLMARYLGGSATPNAYYDTELNITWLRDANYAATELTNARVAAIIVNVGSVEGHILTAADFQPGAVDIGNMFWWGAVAWAEDLVFGGYSDWRLAVTSNTSPTAQEYDCSSGTAAACAASGNELGYMYHFNLDGGGDHTGTQTSGSATLNNIQPHYWGTELGLDHAWLFFFNNVGDMGYGSKTNRSYSWAVRDGDVVPEPATLALVALGLAGLGFSRRKQA